MVILEVEVSASVGGFPVDFGGECRLFPDENIQKRSRTVWFSVHSKFDGRPQTAEVAGEIL
jgi:hypothetical protein